MTEELLEFCYKKLQLWEKKADEADYVHDTTGSMRAYNRANEYRMLFELAENAIANGRRTNDR